MGKYTWTSKAAAVELNVSERTVRRWMEELSIPADPKFIILGPAQMDELRTYKATQYQHRCEAHQGRRGNASRQY